jgi:hypothetical protein
LGPNQQLSANDKVVSQKTVSHHPFSVFEDALYFEAHLGAFEVATFRLVFASGGKNSSTTVAPTIATMIQSGPKAPAAIKLANGHLEV